MYGSHIEGLLRLTVPRTFAIKSAMGFRGQFRLLSFPPSDSLLKYAGMGHEAFPAHPGTNRVLRGPMEAKGVRLALNRMGVDRSLINWQLATVSLL